MKYLLIGILLVRSFDAECMPNIDDTTSELKVFNQGLTYYKTGKLDSALIVWMNFVDKKMGLRYDTYGSAFFNIPTIYWKMNNYNKAKEWYKKILSSELKDNAETGSIMEPHTNYKHKSALALAGLYEIDSNYVEVLYWLDKADTVYRYWGFEGSATSISKKENNLLMWRVSTLQALNKKEDAIRSIIVELVCSQSLESFFIHAEDKLFTLVPKKDLKSDIDIALSALTIKEVDSNNWIASFVLNKLRYDFPISNISPDKNIPHYWRTCFVNKKLIVDKKYFTEYIKGRSFYTRLTN